MKNTQRLLLVLLIIETIFTACSYNSVQPPQDKCGCGDPPPVLVSSSVNINYVLSVMTRFRLEMGVRTQPEALDIVTKAARDQQLHSYLNCCLIRCNGYTKAEVAWLDQMAIIATVNPTELTKWIESHPFPGTNTLVPPSNNEQTQNQQSKNLAGEWAILNHSAPTSFETHSRVFIRVLPSSEFQVFNTFDQKVGWGTYSATQMNGIWLIPIGNKTNEKGNFEAKVLNSDRIEGTWTSINGIVKIDLYRP